MNGSTFLSQSALVALGGALGAWLRFGVGHLVGIGALPYATLTVNVLGSLAMGLLAGWLGWIGQSGEPWRMLLGVGLLGGFTTFSAFSLELAAMINRGQMALACGYALVSVIAGVAALFGGLAMLRVAA